MTAHDLHPYHPCGAVMPSPVEGVLHHLRSALAWKCADAADAAIRFAQRLEPDIDFTAECRRAFAAGLAAGREEYAAMSLVSGHQQPMGSPYSPHPEGGQHAARTGEDGPRLSVV
jgi:hypothetical protein